MSQGFEKVELLKFSRTRQFRPIEESLYDYQENMFAYETFDFQKAIRLLNELTDATEMALEENPNDHEAHRVSRVVRGT